MADAEREDEAVELGLAPRVDRGEQLVEPLESALLGAAALLARLAASPLALPRLFLAPLEQRLLHRRAPVLEREDIGGRA